MVSLLPKGPMGSGEHCPPGSWPHQRVVNPRALHMPKAPANPSLPATSDVSQAIVRGLTACHSTVLRAPASRSTR